MLASPHSCNVNEGDLFQASYSKTPENGQSDLSNLRQPRAEIGWMLQGLARRSQLLLPRDIKSHQSSSTWGILNFRNCGIIAAESVLSGRSSSDYKTMRTCSVRQSKRYLMQYQSLRSRGLAHIEKQEKGGCTTT